MADPTELWEMYPLEAEATATPTYDFNVHTPTATPSPAAPDPVGITEVAYLGGIAMLILIVAFACWMTWTIRRASRPSEYAQRPNPSLDRAHEVFDGERDGRGGSHGHEAGEGEGRERERAAEHRDRRGAHPRSGQADAGIQTPKADVMSDTLAASWVRDHAFVPKGEWYTTCGQIINAGPSQRACGLAESAHQFTSRNPSATTPATTQRGDGERRA